MTDNRSPDPNTCDHGVPLHEECDRCWHDHRVRVDSRTSKNRTLDRFIDLMQQYGAAFAAYEHHHGAWEVDRLAQAREALIAQYRTDGAEIERLTRELEVEKEVNDLAYTSPRHLVKSRNRLLAMLLELQDEIQAVMNGEHGADWADHFAPLFNLVQRAKALSGEHSAPETSHEWLPNAVGSFTCDCCGSVATSNPAAPCTGRDSTLKANEELCPWKGIPKSECRKCSESAHGSEQKANEGQS